MEVFVGTIQMFGFNYAPRGWALCNGQILSLAQNQVLFALIGTYYGGNGTTNFGLPNLQSRQPVGFGTGPGLSPRVIGQSAGTENVTLLSSNMPPQAISTANLTVNTSIQLASAPSTVVTTAPTAANSFLGASPTGGPTSAAIYSTEVGTAVNLQGVSSTIGGTLVTPGSNLPVSVLNPYLAVNFSIALEGLYPSRN
ncbi:phage tail protein [Pseudomonas vanderleydeniana]|uniref:Tail fiber protein n=1 Tax=Pseudomonas vanderleydeniana TaxID=2745495 RepID=A0A9E6TSZ7_9PSED|nr:tail fiber protein [Pseudomonas vanderleydeniana]QXI28710.1 tail fiber protein [Pseudomonas vanderleydeniana]